MLTHSPNEGFWLPVTLFLAHIIFPLRQAEQRSMTISEPIITLQILHCAFVSRL